MFVSGKKFRAIPLPSAQKYEIVCNEKGVAVYEPLFQELAFNTRGKPAYSIYELKTLPGESIKKLELTKEELMDLIQLCTGLPIFKSNTAIANAASDSPKSTGSHSVPPPEPDAAKEKKPYTEPELRVKYDNIRGKNMFHISFSYEHNGILQPVKIPGGIINEITDVKERKKKAEAWRAEIADKLLKGWNPFDKL